MSIKMLDAAFREARVNGTTKLVLLALADHANDDGECWPGMARVRAKAGLSTDAALRKQYRKLEDAGLLEREERFREDGSQASNLYRLRLAPPFLQDRPPRSHRTALEPSLEPEGSKEPSYRCGEVWNHYLSAFNPRRKEPDAGQQKIIEGALKVASVDELKQALDAAAASDWHQKRGAHSTRAGKKHNTLTAILKPKQASAQGPGYTQRERIDFWLDRSETPTADREQIIEAWVEARNAYARGEGPDPGESPFA